MSRFRHFVGGYFRDSTVPRGEKAETLHGDAIIAYVEAETLKRAAGLVCFDYCGNGCAHDPCPAEEDGGSLWHYDAAAETYCYCSATEIWKQLDRPTGDDKR